MDSFEKHTRKALSEESGEIPEGFGWADMETGINQKIEEKKRDRKYPVWFWIFPITLMGLGILWIGLEGVGTPKDEAATEYERNVNYTDTEVNAELVLDVVLDESPKTMSTANELDEQLSNPIKTKTANNSTSMSNSSAILDRGRDSQKLSEQQDLVNDNAKQNPSSTSKGSLIAGSINESDSKLIDIEKSRNEVQDLAREDTDNVSVDDLISSSRSLNANFDINLLEKAGFIFPIYSRSPEIINSLGLTIERQISNEKQFEKENEVYLLNSINAGFWRWNQQVNASDFSIVEKEKPLESYGASMLVGYKVNNWFIETGVSAQVHTSYFENVFERSHTIAADSIPIFNSLTMETRYEQGGTINVTETVKIGHFNQYGQIDIPLQVGYNIPINKLGLYAKSGVQASVLSWEKGRSIKEGGEIDELVSSTTYSTRRGWTYLAELGASYKLSPTWTVQSGISHAQSLNSWTRSNSDVRKPRRLNVQIGLLMNLR